MSGEQTAVALTMAALGGVMIIMGVLARRRLVELALGGWTRDTASPASWDAAHGIIGIWFVAAGVVAIATAVAAAVSPTDWAGPLAGSGSAALLAVVVVAWCAARTGSNRRRRPTCDYRPFARESNTCSLLR